MCKHHCVNFISSREVNEIIDKNALDCGQRSNPTNAYNIYCVKMLKKR